MRRHLFRTIWRLDTWLHERGHPVPLVCTLFDWSCGMTWREARS